MNNVDRDRLEWVLDELECVWGELEERAGNIEEYFPAKADDLLMQADWLRDAVDAIENAMEG